MRFSDLARDGRGVAVDQHVTPVAMLVVRSPSDLRSSGGGRFCLQSSYWYKLASVTQNTIRFPDDMYERIRALAEAGRRSIHAQVLMLLESALTEQGEKVEKS